MTSLNRPAPTCRGKKSKNNYPVKNTVTSPFVAEWQQLSNEETSQILQKITSTFTTSAAVLAKLPTSKGQSVTPDEKLKRALLRSQLALGINEVTRSLEGGKLRLALVCRSAKPALITNHLMSLSATRDVPVLCLRGLSATLAPLLKLKVILAIGFKKLGAKDDTTFDELVQCLTDVTQPVHAPWLQYKELPLQELRKTATDAVLAVKMSKGKGQGPSKLHKKQAGLTKDNEHCMTQTPHDDESKAVAELKQSAKGGDVGPRNQSSSQGERTHSMESVTPAQATGLKRKLSDSPDELLSKKSGQTVLKPNYKSVSVVPVKIIPKKMKNKKERKRKRKERKKKKMCET